MGRGEELDAGVGAERWGVWAVLAKAYVQCQAAILREPHPGSRTAGRDRSRSSGRWARSGRRSASSCTASGGGLAIVTLAEFKRQVIGGPTFSEEGETDDGD